MSSSCLSGRAYRLNLDLIKSPTTTFSTSNSSSSPSSTLSESSNSPLSIFTRKPRTPRKRPNQTYNEAAAILSTAYPKLFPAKNIPKPFKLTKSHDDGRGNFLSEPPDLLIPFHGGRERGCPPPAPPAVKFEKTCLSPGEVTSSRGDFPGNCDEFGEDFDAESILDEEIEEGIDSIMGNLAAEDGGAAVDSGAGGGYCYGFPVGMGFDFGYGLMMRAMRNAGGRERWSSPSVKVVDITAAAVEKKTAATKKKQKKKTEDSAVENSGGAVGRLGLNLNYDDVLSAWSDKGSPFPGDAAAAEAAGKDVQERLEEIELFPENGAAPARGAIVLRYKEKRRTRLFSKKIRYQVRKANADQRPRIKGRFVRTPNSAEDD